MEAGKTLNPYQGLKQEELDKIDVDCSSAGKTLNPYQGLKLDRDSHTGSPRRTNRAGKTLNPYQGLKPRQRQASPRVGLPRAGKTLNPYQGLKL